MTNEEKAREIIKCGDWCESINKCDYKNTGVNCYAYGIAMRMAEWKEDQMIEKASEWVKKNLIHRHESPLEIFNLLDDFKKAMEE